MIGVLTMIGVGSMILLGWAGVEGNRKLRRRRLLAKPWPTQWEDILQKNVPFYKKLPADLQEQLHGLVQVFLAEKNFEGCGGLELTEEIKVTVAAQACVLLLNRPTNFFPKLQSILVYPTAYVAKGVQQHGWGVFVEKEQVRLGESWHQGIVVLAWDNILHGARDVHDGHNVVFHEFAHQLDQEDGYSDGAPLLESGSHYQSWSRHLGEVYEKLQEAVAKHRETFLDQYGATNPAEFFAVVTETFFEKPGALKRKIPALYEELKKYYKLDPTEWEKP